MGDKPYKSVKDYERVKGPDPDTEEHAPAQQRTRAFTAPVKRGHEDENEDPDIDSDITSSLQEALGPVSLSHLENPSGGQGSGGQGGG